ncbi:MAG: adenylate/guanylate cyclase domain-containing protein [Chloroflexi bacterium]|nr:adenylate/guanylate cyclase domain-containing protein [Chloroflexota bacterium]
MAYNNPTMEPRILYVKTSDGVNIAYTTMGEGLPLVQLQGWPFCHLEAERWVPTLRLLQDRLAEKLCLVRFDQRGSGLSQRDVDDLSVAARVLDLEAVVDHLELDRVALNGWGTGGPVAISYAAQHPDRVSHLSLVDSYAHPADYTQSERAASLITLMNSDWDLFTETVASVFFGWSGGEPARKLAAYLRECVTPEEGRAAMAAALSEDVTPMLPDVQAPTIVVRARQNVYSGVDVARSLAAAIPNASLDSSFDAAWLTSEKLVEEALTQLLSFLGVDDDVHRDATTESGAFRTVLFTDVEGSTALTQRLGDAKARELLREHERMVREALKAHGGSEVKTLGDGFMASFSSATEALECAITMQRAFAERNESAEEPIMVRIGLNAGEPIAEDDDLFGTAVNLAARICGHAEAGQILAPIVVRELTAGKQFMFADLGETELRGFEDPVHIYQVSWREP